MRVQDPRTWAARCRSDPTSSRLSTDRLSGQPIIPARVEPTTCGIEGLLCLIKLSYLAWVSYRLFVKKAPENDCQAHNGMGTLLTNVTPHRKNVLYEAEIHGLRAFVSADIRVGIVP
eukprot:scaffold11409_cov17-Prasinocladus_malaysianus.AAC.1